MRKLAIIMAIGMFLIAASLLPAAKQAAAATDVEEGDFWTYEAGGELQGMTASVKMKMKVTGTEGSGADEVFVISLSGSGSVSGESAGITVSGDVDYSGEMKRLTSNLSLVYSNIEMVISMEAMGQKLKMTMGIEQTYSPALDDYIGDDPPDYGESVESASEVTTTTTLKMEMAGQVIEDVESTETDMVEQTIVMASANSSVDVPAGTFDCLKYTCTVEMSDIPPQTMTYYYSDKVGNFVKSEGTMSMTGGLGDSELKAYSHAGNSAGTSSSMFSGTNLLIIIVIIVAIIVVVGLVLMMRKRGRAATPMPPPVESAPPPPPPGV